MATESSRGGCDLKDQDLVLRFLGVFVYLVFLFLEISLVFLSVLGLFYSVFEGSQSEKIFGIFEVFLGVLEKTKEKKDRGGRDQRQSRSLGRGCDEALFSEQKGFFSEKGGRNSVNEGFGKDFYRKGNSVKRSGRFSKPPDSQN